MMNDSIKTLEAIVHLVGTEITRLSNLQSSDKTYDTLKRAHLCALDLEILLCDARGWNTSSEHPRDQL